MGRKRNFSTGREKLLDLFNHAQLRFIHVDHHPEDDQPTHQFTSNYGFRLRWSGGNNSRIQNVHSSPENSVSQHPLTPRNACRHSVFLSFQSASRVNLLREIRLATEVKAPAGSAASEVVTSKLFVRVSINKQRGCSLIHLVLPR